jgi:16S rRNA (guanine(966)-N(2))-methyltransferase RsmD
MRIIAGTKRGMTLFSPKTCSSRPVTDRVKQSVFNILRSYDLPGDAFVADLFCGVGSFGLEALSNGAQFVAFIDSDPKVLSVLGKNIEKAGFASQSKVIRADAFRVGAIVDSHCPLYDLVFVDPPYVMTRDVGDRSQLAGLMNALAGQVVPNGVVILRTQRRTPVLDVYGNFAVVDRRLWGTIAVTFLVRPGISVV